MSRGGRGGGNGPHGGGYDHYRSDNYLGGEHHGSGAADHYTKNGGGVSWDSGSNHGIRSNAGAAARNRLEILESERKNMALIKGNGQNGSYGGGPGSRASYDRSMENRNHYMNNHHHQNGGSNMTPA